MSLNDFEVRCPIHGLIPMNAWERRLIDTQVFQRLRRIRQLAWTDFVYPGAMHTRFEHSIGVMHTAGQLYDSILQNSPDVLAKVYGDTGEKTGWRERDRQKVRLAALLHDIGHSPFSHASEDLFPEKEAIPSNLTLSLFQAAGKEEPKKRFKHEDYSIALIEHELRSAIEDDDFNSKNFGIRAEEITNLLRGDSSAGPTLFWREILSHQLDADRMDYLLRDSHHLGVRYGNYDFNRLVTNVCACEVRSEADQSPRVRVGLLKGGLFAAESLIVARYSMFKQVYFHKTRMAYDIHLQQIMANLLADEGLDSYPRPDAASLKEYLKWDDWKVQGLLAAGKGGPHAQQILTRAHYRMVYSSQDRLIKPKEKQAGQQKVRTELKKLEAVKAALGDLLAKEKRSSNSWYKAKGNSDILVVEDHDRSQVKPLSFYSAMPELNAEDQVFLYVAPENVPEAKQRITAALIGFDSKQRARMVSSSVEKQKIQTSKKTKPKKKKPKAVTDASSLYDLDKGEPNVG